MTPAEEKVREISDKLVTRIDELRAEGYTEASILATVRNYLIGITDGIDFAERDLVISTVLIYSFFA